MTTTTSASAIKTTSEEMTSDYASFCSDDTLIEIIPSFDYNNNNNSSSAMPVMLSTIPIGPFTAGIPAIVPIWIGLFFHHRSLGTIVLPSWLCSSNISTIIQYERSNGSLYHNTAKLPLNYYEITNRLMKVLLMRNASSSSTSFGGGGSGGGGGATTGPINTNNLDAIQLLIQDLFDIRMDKLRKQFQDLSAQTVDVNDLIVDVTGIGTQERALLQRFVTQALADYHYLNTTTTTTKSNNDGSGNDTTAKNNKNIITTRATKTNSDENDDKTNKNLDDNSSVPMTVDERTTMDTVVNNEDMPAKRSIRRFR
jgi:GINS complex protein